MKVQVKGDYLDMANYYRFFRRSTRLLAHTSEEFKTREHVLIGSDSTIDGC